MSSEKKIHISAKIGEGIFLTKDVSEILRLPYSKVRYSMSSFWCEYTFGSRKNKAINFYSLIEFFIFYHLREFKISSGTIKKVHSKMAKDLDTIYPFAHYKIRTDSKSIWYEKFGNLIKVDGKRQFDLEPLLESFLKRVEYGKDDTAQKYFPLSSDNIVIDPTRQFGKPIVNGKNIRTEVIYRFFLGGETKENICNLYDLSIGQVEDAIIFHQQAA